MKGTCFLFRLNKAQKKVSPLAGTRDDTERICKNNFDLLYHKKIKLSIAELKG